MTDEIKKSPKLLNIDGNSKIKRKNSLEIVKEKIINSQIKEECEFDTPKEHHHHKKKKKKDKKSKKDKEKDKEKEKQKKKPVKKSVFNDQFILNGNYNLIKMLGYGAFGEIHLAYDTIARNLKAIKFEIATHKNPQLKHEFNILEQLNKEDDKKITNKKTINFKIQQENLLEKIGIPEVYIYDRMENKYNYMIMEFLGPSLLDLFYLKEKSFTLETILMIGIQMLCRIEYIHEKGFVHRDIKPENFVIGIDDKSNIIHIIDFGLSKRFKDKNTGQHIPYRENRHLVGTVRYASINSHLEVEQSRRDDIESIGYVLVYFLLGRLPWQNIGGGKGKAPQPHLVMEKKLITPPEILCKKLPSQFSYYFHYCRNLKFEDRPDYATLKTIFAEILYSKLKIGSLFTYDWFTDKKKEEEKEVNKELENKGQINQINENENNDLANILKVEDETPNGTNGAGLSLSKYGKGKNGFTDKIICLREGGENHSSEPPGISHNESDSKTSNESEEDSENEEEEIEEQDEPGDQECQEVEEDEDENNNSEKTEEIKNNSKSNSGCEEFDKKNSPSSDYEILDNKSKKNDSNDKESKSGEIRSIQSNSSSNNKNTNNKDNSNSEDLNKSENPQSDSNENKNNGEDNNNSENSNEKVNKNSSNENDEEKSIKE